MFYCPLHNWYSTEEPCKVCHQVKTYTTSTYELDSDLNYISPQERLYTRDEMKACFRAAKKKDYVAGVRQPVDTWRNFENYILSLIANESIKNK